MNRDLKKTLCFIKCFFLAYYLGFTGASPVAGDEVIQLATRHNLPPYVYDNANSGIEIDLIKAIFKDIGRDIEFVQMPRIRMIQTFDQQGIDGILTQNETVSDVGCITNWYLKHQNVGFMLAREKTKLESLSDLKGLPVLSFDGAQKYLGKDFRDAVQDNPRYRESTNQAGHIELLYLGRFKVIVGDEWILRLAQRQYLDKSGMFKRLIAHYIMPPSFYAARFHDKKICEAFNTSLTNLRSTGNYDQIVANYHKDIMVAEK